MNHDPYNQQHSPHHGSGYDPMRDAQYGSGSGSSRGILFVLALIAAGAIAVFFYASVPTVDGNGGVSTTQNALPGAEEPQEPTTLQ